MLNVNNLVNKTDYNAKFNETQKKIIDYDKCITTLEFNKLRSDTFTARLSQANLGCTHQIANFVKKTDFDDKQKKK